MRLKKLFLLILAIILVLISTGCFDAADINEKSLVTLVVLDLVDDEFVFHIEVPNLAFGHQGTEGAGGGYETYSTIKGTGKTYAETRQSLDLKMDSPIFLGTVRALLLTENLVKYRLDEYMYRLQADPGYRKAVYVVTTSDDPEDLFDVKPENNVSIGYSIDALMTTLTMEGRKLSRTTSEVLEYLASDACFVLPAIGLEGGDIACTGYMVIHEAKYGGFIPTPETKGLVWMLGDHPEFFYDVPFGDNMATVYVTLKKRSITPYYSKDNLIFDIEFEFDAKIHYLQKNLPVGKEEEDQINQELQNMLIKDLSDTVYKSKTLQCDYLGLHDIFRIHYPTENKEIEDWCPEFVNSQVKISVTSMTEPGVLADFESQSKAKSVNEAK